MNNIEFNEQFFAIEARLFVFAIRLTRNSNDAQDLLQETAYRAYRSRDNFHLGTNFKAWITTIMHHSFISEYHRQQKRNDFNQPLDTFTFMIENKNTVSNSADSTMMMQELSSLFSEIGEEYARPFLMFYRGYSYVEIGEEMNIPLGTVKSRLFFARKKLQELIKQRYNS